MSSRRFTSASGSTNLPSARGPSAPTVPEKFQPNSDGAVPIDGGPSGRGMLRHWASPQALSWRGQGWVSFVSVTSDFSAPTNKGSTARVGQIGQPSSRRVETAPRYATGKDLGRHEPTHGVGQKRSRRTSRWWPTECFATWVPRLRTKLNRLAYRFHRWGPNVGRSNAVSLYSIESYG